MNPYVAGGYGATAGMLGTYVVYVRHRARVLAKLVPAEVDAPSDDEDGRDASQGDRPRA
jgi:hypothetical protein